MSVLLLIVAVWLAFSTLATTAMWAKAKRPGQVVAQVVIGAIVVTIIVLAALRGVTP